MKRSEMVYIMLEFERSYASSSALSPYSDLNT